MFTHTHTRYASTRRVLHVVYTTLVLRVVYTTLVQRQVREDRQSPLGHAPCFALRPPLLKYAYVRLEAFFSRCEFVRIEITLTTTATHRCDVQITAG